MKSQKELTTLFVGFDVSKKHHDMTVINRRRQEVYPTRRIFENKEGYSKVKQILLRLKERYEGIKFVIGMESTSIYGRNLYKYIKGLDEIEKEMRLINPKRTHTYAKMNLHRTETDKIASRTIAKFLTIMDKKHPEPKELDEVSKKLRKLTKLREKMIKERTKYLNGLHQELDTSFPELKEFIKDETCIKALRLLEEYPTAQKLARGKIEKISQIRYGKNNHRIGRGLAEKIRAVARESIASESYEFIIKMYVNKMIVLNQEIKAVEKEIGNIMKKECKDHPVPTIIGIGPITTATLIGKLGIDIKDRFTTPKQFTAYLGIEPALKESGDSLKLVPRMSKAGDKLCRKAIYIATLAAISSNPIIGQYYHYQLSRGKKKMVAIGACMRKMCHIIYAVWKKNEAFKCDDNIKRRENVA